VIDSAQRAAGDELLQEQTSRRAGMLEVSFSLLYDLTCSYIVITLIMLIKLLPFSIYYRMIKLMFADLSSSFDLLLVSLIKLSFLLDHMT
jgi:hypothetical protein